MKLLTLLFSFYNLKWKAITIPQLIDFSKHFLSTKIHFLWWSCTSVDFLTDCDSFHLCLFDFPLIYQFYSIMTTLVRTTCWNLADLIIWKSFQKNLMRSVNHNRNAAFAPISFEVQWNVILNDNIQSFQISFELLS